MSKSFGYEIVIKNGETSVIERLNGKKKNIPLYWIQSDDQHNVAEACRSAAFELLQQAFYCQHGKEFVMSEMDIQSQVDLMLIENLSSTETIHLPGVGSYEVQQKDLKNGIEKISEMED